MRVVSVAYLALVANPGDPTAGRNTKRAEWVSVREAENHSLAFDHGEILAAGVERARSKLEYTTLATSFCDEEFTITELRTVYETVWGTELDAANFHRKVLATDNFVSPTGRTQQAGRRSARKHLCKWTGKTTYPTIT